MFDNLYVVRNSEGKYFRRKGYGGYGESWTDDEKKARVFASLGPARTTVTFFSKNPAYPVPDIVRLVVSGVEVLDEKVRVEKALKKKALEKEKQEVYRKRRAVEKAELDLADAQRRLKEVADV